MVKLCEDYGIKIKNSTAYYPQGNGLDESSKKRMVKIIKNLLEDNKRYWDSKLKYALWVDRVSTKRVIGTSPFQLVYGMEAIIPVQLSFLVVKFLQEIEVEPNDVIRGIF
jgi:hypothetical protein